jgi:hypothetical protein
VPTASLIEVVGQELVFSLPLTLELRQTALPMLQRLLDALDAQTEQLGINSYGIADTSLEEIFLKVAAHGEQTDGEKEQQKAGTHYLTSKCVLSSLSCYRSMMVLTCYYL